MESNIDFRYVIFQELDRTLSGTFDVMTKVLMLDIHDIDLIQTLTYFLIGFRNCFEVENFL